jgi:hypothetical protein
MCRRWAGGPFFAVASDEVVWEGEAPGIYASSAWAERGFCRSCGSSLFYRITAEGPHHGLTSLASGTLDDQEGLPLTREWFIDRKPGIYELAGERERLSSAEIAAMFGGD